MKYITLLYLIFLLSACSNYGQLTFISKLPQQLKESSGIAHFQNEKVWILEDHGNEDVLYQINFDGKLLKELKVKNAKNEDWEDLTTDKSGNLYIADIGNNNNKRKDLVVYKVPNPEIEPGDKIDAEKIEFKYPEQKDFPPKKNNLLFDAEAIFHFKNHLYIVTKNRTVPFDGRTFIYKIPDTKGTYAAELVSEFVSCKEDYNCQITSAALSPNGKKLVLLSYGFLWIYTDFEGDNFTSGTLEKINLGATTQLESVCFKDDNTLLLADEERAKTGQNLYSFTLK